jgi:aminoglycoside 6-adenylyltransferase
MESGPEIVRRVTTWAGGQAPVRAALLTGSRSRQGAAIDRFSDFDIVLYVVDPKAFLADPGWFSSLGGVLVSFQDRSAFPVSGWYTQLVLHEDGTKVDYTIAPVAHLARLSAEARLSNELDVGYTVLIDKDGLADSLPAASGRAWIPARPTQAEFSALVEEFWWESGYVVRNLAREEVLPAKHSLEVVMKLDLLRRMLEWFVEVGCDWSWRPGVLGRGLREVLDERTWSELEATFAAGGIEENWIALFRTIDLFRRVARTVATRLDLEYQSDIDSGMMSYLHDVKEPEGGRWGSRVRPARGGAMMIRNAAAHASLLPCMLAAVGWARAPDRIS